MNITLPREQQEWLEAQVKAGAYDSIDQAISDIVGQRMLYELIVRAEQQADKLARPE